MQRGQVGLIFSSQILPGKEVKYRANIRIMFDYIGEKIRLKLATLDWISRTGGYAIPAEVMDAGTKGGYPSAPYFDGAECSPAERLNMAPDERETAIAFVDSDGQINPVRRTARYIDFSTSVRVVLWFNTVKQTYEGDSDREMQMMSDIVSAVQSTDLKTEGLGLTRIRFSSIQYDAAQIWNKYGMRTEGQGLFTYPYKTLALTFTVTGRLVMHCFTGEVTANAAAC